MDDGAQPASGGRERDPPFIPRGGDRFKIWEGIVRKRLTWVVAGALVVSLVPSTAFAAVVAQWKMDEGSGASVMTDSAGGDNNGAISSVITGVPGLAGGNAYQFDGATSYVNVPDAPELDPGTKDIALQATVKVEDGEILDDSYDIVRKGITSTPGGDFKMEIKRNGTDTTVGKLLCVFKGTNTVKRQARPDIVDGRAHTLKCIKKAGSVQAVVDGRSYTTTATAGAIANDQPVVLGSKVAGDDVLQGVLDEVSINIGG